ncbi:hypothetical protein JVU11DRAFT_302 [Chiua virens]|nr:hypothetical protein JVU11DRAFT_302 [Chiua virens]
MVSVAFFSSSQGHPTPGPFHSFPGSKWAGLLRHPPSFTMFQLIVIVSLYLTLVHADYTIDDSNYSILKFSENPSGPVWGPFGSNSGEVLEIRLPNGTYQTVDATQCYDGTYWWIVYPCTSVNVHALSTLGSGITIYVLQAGPQGMSASLYIDSGKAHTATLAAPSPPQYYISHVTLFNIQNMPSGTHTAVMTVLDWNGSFSGMMLDYINVNQTQVSDPTSSSPSPGPTPDSAQSPPSDLTSANQQSSSSNQPAASQLANATQAAASVASVTSVVSFPSGSGATALPSDTASGNGTVTTSSSSSTPKKTNVATVAGGVVGGVGLLALVGGVFLCIRQRRRRLEQAHDEAAPHPLSPPLPEARFTGRDAPVVNPFASSAALVVSPIQSSPGTAHPWHSWTDSPIVSVPNVAVWDPRNPDPGADMSRHTRSTSSGNSAASSLPMDGVTSPQSSRPPMSIGYTYLNEKSRPAISRSTSTSSSTQPRHQGHQTAPTTTSTNAAQLTDEQADFVNTLFNNNVPGPVVARVLERMLTNPQGANTIVANDPELRAHLDPNNLLGSSQPLVWGNTAWTSTLNEMEPETAPPSYDDVRAQQ